MTRYTSPIVCTGILLLSTALPMGAQEAKPILLDEITLSAGLEDTELSRSGSAVSVLNAQALQDKLSQPVADTLLRLPGTTIRTRGPLGTLASVQVRGAPGEYVPVLIDGIEVSDPAAGQPEFNFGGLTDASLQRVELLRGTQSAIYGSRAIGGVLSLDSLRPTQDGLHHNFSIEAGQYHTFAGTYGVTLRQNSTDLAFSATRITSRGFSAADENDGNFEDDGFRSTRLTFYAAQELQNGTTIGLNGFWEKNSAEFDDWGGDRAETGGTPGNDKVDTESYGLRAFAEFSTGALDHSVNATRYHIDRANYQDNTGPSYLPNVVERDDFIGTRTKLSWQTGTDLGASGARAVFGADTMGEDADGLGKTRQNGVFAQVSVPVRSDIDVDASIRHDHHSEFGGFRSFRLAGVWRAHEDLLIRAAHGTGFRAPSLYERYSEYGAPNLTQENGRSSEIGIEKRWNESDYLRATAFYLKSHNMIGFDSASKACGAPYGCYAQVDGASSRRGVEVDGQWSLGQVSLNGAYTYTDNSSTVRWAEVSEHVLNLWAEYEFAQGTKSALWLHAETDRPNDLGTFATLNLTVSHPLSEQAEAYIRVENLLDRQYQLVRNYGTSDRAVYVGLRAQF